MACLGRKAGSGVKRSTIGLTSEVFFSLTSTMYEIDVTGYDGKSGLLHPSSMWTARMSVS